MSDLGTKRPLICYHSTTLLTHRVRRNPRHHALNDGDSCDIVAQLSLPAPGLPPPYLFEPRFGGFREPEQDEEVLVSHLQQPKPLTTSPLSTL